LRKKIDGSFFKKVKEDGWIFFFFLGMCTRGPNWKRECTIGFHLYFKRIVSIHLTQGRNTTKILCFTNSIFCWYNFNRQTHRQLLFVGKLIVGDLCYVGKFIDNIIIDGFTKHVKQKKLSTLFCWFIPR
jgi:hypothetical protein